jgi:hypothetical protein
VILLGLAVFGYWIAMNTFVVLRQREFAELGRHRQGVAKFLGGQLLRERWMGVYKDHKKIGYTSFSMEKVRPEEGVEFHCAVETYLTFDLFGRGQRLRLNARLVQDEELRPLRLQGNVSIDDKFGVRLSGERREGLFHLAVKTGETKLLELPLPLEDLFLGDGLIPSLPMTGFTPGETFRLPCFDPLAMARDMATVTVLREETAVVDGVEVDCFVLETTFHGGSSISYVTRDGEVLVQKFGPPLEGVVLKKESRDRALRGLPR